MFRPGGRPCKDWEPSMLGFPQHKICRLSCYRPLLSQHRRPSLVRQWHIVGGSCHPLWWTSHSTRWPTSTHLVLRKSCVGICHKRKMARLPLTGRFHLSRIRPRTMKVTFWGTFVNIFLKDLHNQIFSLTWNLSSLIMLLPLTVAWSWSNFPSSWHCTSSCWNSLTVALTSTTFRKGYIPEGSVLHSKWSLQVVLTGFVNSRSCH